MSNENTTQQNNGESVGPMLTRDFFLVAQKNGNKELFSCYPVSQEQEKENEILSEKFLELADFIIDVIPSMTPFQQKAIRDLYSSFSFAKQAIALKY